LRNKDASGPSRMLARLFTAGLFGFAWSSAGPS
jgi:hypothetical protein